MEKEEIVKAYLAGASAREVAEQFGCAYSTVSSIVRDRGLSRGKGPRKHISEAKVRRCPEFSNDFKDYLDGLLLSDGSLDAPIATRSSKYSQSCTHRAWLRKIKTTFTDNGIESSIGDENRITKKSCWQLQTFRYDGLARAYDRWYPSKIKKVPRDINLASPTLLRNWLYGDGTLIRGSTLRLCTDSFSEEDIDWMSKSLKKFLGVEFRKLCMGWTHTGLPKFRLCLCLQDGLDRFFDYVGSCEIPVFDYKWRIS